MIVKRRFWDTDTADSLAAALGVNAPIVGREVLDGVAEVFEFEGCGHVVTRIEQTVFGPELVIVAGQGAHGDKVLPVLLDAARGNGCVSVRAHSSRPGMGRYLARYGFTEKERVYGRQVIQFQ